METVLLLVEKILPGVRGPRSVIHDKRLCLPPVPVCTAISVGLLFLASPCRHHGDVSLIAASIEYFCCDSIQYIRDVSPILRGV